MLGNGPDGLDGVELAGVGDVAEVGEVLADERLDGLPSMAAVPIVEEVRLTDIGPDMIRNQAEEAINVNCIGTATEHVNGRLGQGVDANGSKDGDGLPGAVEDVAVWNGGGAPGLLLNGPSSEGGLVKVDQRLVFSKDVAQSYSKDAAVGIKLRSILERLPVHDLVSCECRYSCRRSREWSKKC